MDAYNFTESERLYVAKAEQYCANGEQCRASVKEKLTVWGAGQDVASRIVDYLVDSGFIDEHRYCRIYCESKLHLMKWGRVKMRYQLRMKHIDGSIIDNAIQNLDQEQYMDTLARLAGSKLATIQDPDPRKRRSKLMAFLSSHGFTPDEINQTVDELAFEYDN
ncbi:MAG: RecX family transcriptional regulator [Bacteroidales bacterium]|nr:RecX family transcriptional regulator [Bacteroidales bacterium]